MVPEIGPYNDCGVVVVVVIIEVLALVSKSSRLKLSHGQCYKAKAKILALKQRPEDQSQGLSQGQSYKAKAKILASRPDQAKILARLRATPKPRSVHEAKAKILVSVPNRAKFWPRGRG